MRPIRPILNRSRQCKRSGQKLYEESPIVPRISTITVALNSKDSLQKCIDSVAIQQNCSVEHIVVDGGSSDGTLDILHQNEHRLRTWISEPDEGIYDAMNKGIGLAEGDIIGLLNSDDYYSDELVLSRVIETLRNTEAKACYGDIVYVDRNDTKKVTRQWKTKKLEPRHFYWGAMPPHPAFFVRKEVYAECGNFRLDLGSAADYEFMLRVLVRFRMFAVHIPFTLVHMRSGGISNATIWARLKANRMDREAWKVNGLHPFPWTVILKPLRKLPQWWIR